MEEAKFIISLKKLKEQVETLKKLKLTISYSHKTNKKISEIGRAHV